MNDRQVVILSGVSGAGKSTYADKLVTSSKAAVREIVSADHFFGTTVHYAARVAGEAMGGEVLVSSLVRDLVGNDTFVEGPEVELKGLDGRHRLYALATA